MTVNNNIAEKKQAPSIVFENVSLTYDAIPLFDRLCLEIEGGRCTCILGPSGCGKSTLLKMISGSPDTPYQGQIVLGAAEKSATCAWMSQKDLLLPWLTVLENVLLGARLRGEVDDVLKEKAGSLLVEAGLDNYSSSLPAVLSGGMRQRVALLRTLMENRPVLLMDEPFSALDALTRLKLQNLSATMTRGKTVILVTHDPLEALRLGDTIIVLAGNPARVDTSLCPKGSAPRDANDEIFSRDYPVLLSRLLDAEKL